MDIIFSFFITKSATEIGYDARNLEYWDRLIHPGKLKFRTDLPQCSIIFRKC